MANTAYYPVAKISAVRFLNRAQQVRERIFVTGTWQQQDNSLHLWSIDSPAKIQLLQKQDFDGEVCAILPLKEELVATASSTGNVAIYFRESNQLKQVCERQVTDTVLTSLAAAGTGVLAADEEGSVSLIPLDKPDGSLKMTSVSESPITCLDAVPGCEVLCGNTAGCVKVIDSRSVNVTATLCNSLCPITTVRRNISNPHLIVSLRFPFLTIMSNTSLVAGDWDTKRQPMHVGHEESGCSSSTAGST